MMNRDILKGNWKQLKGKIKQQWAKLTDDDLAMVEGSYDELEGIIQKRYGYEKDQSQKEIDSFLETFEKEDSGQ